MAGLGTEVGDAFIEVHADTGAFRRELRAAAAAAAQDFGSRFGTRLDKVMDGQLTKLGVNVRKALDKQGRLGGKNFADAVEGEVSGLADRLTTLLARAAVSGDFTDFAEQVGGVSKASDALNKILRELHEAEQITVENSDRIAGSFREWLKVTEELTAARDREAAKTREAQFAMRAFEERVKSLVKTEQDAVSERDRIQRAIEKNSAASWRRQANNASAFFQSVRKGSVDATRILRQEAEEQAAAAEEAAKAYRTFGQRISDFFSSIDRDQVRFLSRLKGSRNDFLNLIGSMSAGLERLSSNVISGGLNSIGQALANLGTRLLQTEGPLSGVGAALGAMGARIQGLGSGGIDGLVVQLVALSVSLQGAALIAGVAAAGISTLAGALTALTVSVGGALVGGLLLLGPLIAGLAASIGVLTLGFSDLTDAEKAVFAPLNNLLNSVRDAVQSALFRDISSQVGALTNALSPMSGVLVAVAEATRDWFSATLAAFDPSGPLGGSLTILEQSLPGIVRGLLDLLTNTSTLLVGLFAQASPAAQTFLDLLNGVVLRFSEWLNSSGDQRLANFLNTALGLLSQLGGIAASLGTSLRLLFEGGASAGSTLLTMLQNILNEFNAWLATEEGRDALSQWFRDSVTAIQAVGQVLGALITLFATLDNPSTRSAFTFILQSLTQVINFISITQAVFNHLAGQIGAGAAAIGGFIAGIGTAIWNAAQAFAAATAPIIGHLARVGSAIDQIPGLLQRAFGFAGNLLYQAGVDTIAGLQRGIAAAAQGVLNYIARLAGQIATAFRNALGIRSPSRVFAQYGENIAEGLAQGIVAGAGLVNSALDNLIDSSMLSNLNTPVSTLATQGATNASGVGVGSGTVVESGAITVVTPYADPRLVATEVMDALAVRGK